MIKDLLVYLTWWISGFLCGLFLAQVLIVDEILSLFITFITIIFLIIDFIVFGIFLYIIKK